MFPVWLPSIPKSAMHYTHGARCTIQMYTVQIDFIYDYSEDPICQKICWLKGT